MTDISQSVTTIQECIKSEIPIRVKGSLASERDLEDHNLNQATSDVSFITDRDNRIECTVSLDRKAYRPGSPLKLSIDMTNASESRVSSITTKLIQEIHFYDSRHELLLDESVELGYIRAGLVLPNSRLVDKRNLVLPDDVVETVHREVNTPTKLISIKYYVDVQVDSLTDRLVHLRVPFIVANTAPVSDDISIALKEEESQYVPEKVSNEPSEMLNQSTYRGYGVKLQPDLTATPQSLRITRHQVLSTPRKQHLSRPILMDSPMVGNNMFNETELPSPSPRKDDIEQSTESSEKSHVVISQQNPSSLEQVTTPHRNTVSIQTVPDNHVQTQTPSKLMNHIEREKIQDPKVYGSYESPLHKELINEMVKVDPLEEECGPEYPRLINSELHEDNLEVENGPEDLSEEEVESLGYKHESYPFGKLEYRSETESSEISEKETQDSEVSTEKGNGLNGIVEMVFENGGRYIGEQLNGMMNGVGDYFYPNGSVYRGHWYNGVKSGPGRLEYSDDSVYEGEWVNDHRHGFGVYTTDHYQYEGNWSQDQKYGKGTISYSNGERYEGEWIANYPSGFGVYLFRDGSRYSGQFSKGLRHGYGSLFYSDGCTIYDGDWVYDKKHGRATITFINGVYTGEVKEDVKEGFGIYRYSNGDSYEGHWFNNKKHGKGVYTFNEGGFYKGNWVCGIKNGEGVLEMPNGTQYAEQWINGKLISKTKLTRPSRK